MIIAKKYSTSSELIKKTKGEPEYRDSNLINAYVAFYYFLKDNIVTLQSIYGLLEDKVA